MQLSPRTLAILKNFANIYTGIVIKPGNSLRTATEATDLLVDATVEDTFEKQFAIANLSQFLGILSSFESPKLKFKEKILTINEKGREYSYTYGEEVCIKSPPDEKLVLPKSIAAFKLTEKMLHDMTRIAAVSQFPEIAVVGEKDNLYLRGMDCKNATNNVYNQKVDGETKSSFMAVFGADKLNALMPMDYIVTVTKGPIQFTGADMTYWIAPFDKYSTYA